MDRAAHTPGPWRVSTNPMTVWAGRWPGHSRGQVEIEQDGLAPGVGVPQLRANARLIASAPELLEELKAARLLILSLVGGRASAYAATIGAIDAAIGRAEGKEAATAGAPD